MTNEQYPELPRPDTHCFDEDTGQDVWSYSESQMRAYVDADRAMRAVQLDACSRCGARVFDPFGLRVVIHDVERCKSFNTEAKPTREAGSA